VDGKNLKPTKFDIIIFAILLLTSAFFITNKGGGDKKLFLISANEKKEIPLQHQFIKLNDGNVVIEVSSEGARFIENDCPTKFCIKSGWVTKCGQTVACVPNKYAIVIECKEEAYDAVSR